MKLISWTFFIDMLGYRDINGEINTEEKAKEFIDFMNLNKQLFDFSNSDSVKERYKKDKQFNLYEYYDIKYSFISDSLVINLYPKEVESLKIERKKYMHSANALFIILMRLQTFIYACFKEKQLFLRGGVSTKYCYLVDNFAVGEGLIDAYLTESKVAVHPRIAFSDSVFSDKKLVEQVEFLGKEMYGRSILKSDENGVYYLDYLGYSMSCVDRSNEMVYQQAHNNLSMYLSQLQSTQNFIESHATAISSKLSELKSRQLALSTVEEKSKIQKVIDKFEWLKDYHNSTIGDFSDFVDYVVE
ncbi:conserved hypothetical protein [Vibrio chagasii]|nr:conserved hypothetical protein [Vibrio chagasii]CAH7006154.1 conserved hypothetical protein [Vibrio chagasii]CAH7094447.1 conserved hypothetical protein [Vibrio chagasii]CAH7145834.1 conserved hypothetical protein [Vibrio chagasii]CAH7153300.1 conserved hypothetical protein [Vibrio chagasii]